MRASRWIDECRRRVGAGCWPIADRQDRERQTQAGEVVSHQLFAEHVLNVATSIRKKFDEPDSVYIQHIPHVQQHGRPRGHL